MLRQTYLICIKPSINHQHEDKLTKSLTTTKTCRHCDKERQIQKDTQTELTDTGEGWE